MGFPASLTKLLDQRTLALSVWTILHKVTCTRHPAHISGVEAARKPRLSTPSQANPQCHQSAVHQTKFTLMMYERRFMDYSRVISNENGQTNMPNQKTQILYIVRKRTAALGCPRISSNMTERGKDMHSLAVPSAPPMFARIVSKSTTISNHVGSVHLPRMSSRCLKTSQTLSCARSAVPVCTPNS